MNNKNNDDKKFIDELNNYKEKEVKKNFKKNEAYFAFTPFILIFFILTAYLMVPLAIIYFIYWLIWNKILGNETKRLFYKKTDK